MIISRKFLLSVFILLNITVIAQKEVGVIPKEKLISKKQFDMLFPHRDTLYHYESFIEATKRFPTFATEGTELQNKQELMAFFANVAHETTDGWPEAEGGPYVWGLVYKEEQAC